MFELGVKHMVCDRCKKVVSDELAQIDGISVAAIELGRVWLRQAPGESRLGEIARRLEAQGFELIDDQKSRLILSLKTLIIEEIHHQGKRKRDDENFSRFLSRRMGYDYSYLNDLFASLEGKTIGKYIVDQKIEKIKELLTYDELSLSEIAWRMGYSSVQYLSAQFKKHTGMTPTRFKVIGGQKRKPLDRI